MATTQVPVDEVDLEVQTPASEVLDRALADLERRFEAERAGQKGLAEWSVVEDLALSVINSLTPAQRAHLSSYNLEFASNLVRELTRFFRLSHPNEVRSQPKTPSDHITSLKWWG